MELSQCCLVLVSGISFYLNKLAVNVVSQRTQTMQKCEMFMKNYFLIQSILLHSNLLSSHIQNLITLFSKSLIPLECLSDIRPVSYHLNEIQVQMRLCCAIL